MPSLAEMRMSHSLSRMNDIIPTHIQHIHTIWLMQFVFFLHTRMWQQLLDDAATRRLGKNVHQVSLDHFGRIIIFSVEKFQQFLWHVVQQIMPSVWSCTVDSMIAQQIK